MINDTRPTPWLVSKRHHYIDRQIFGGLGSWFVSWEVPVKEIISTEYGFFARIQRTSPNHQSIIASMIDEKPTSYPRWAVPKALNCSLFMGVVLRTSIGFSPAAGVASRCLTCLFHWFSLALGWQLPPCGLTRTFIFRVSLRATEDAPVPPSMGLSKNWVYLANGHWINILNDYPQVHVYIGKSSCYVAG